MYKYLLIEVETAGEMNQEVNELLVQGWEPFMGLVVGWRCLFQWMIRNEIDRKSPGTWRKDDRKAMRAEGQCLNRPIT